MIRMTWAAMIIAVGILLQANVALPQDQDADLDRVPNPSALVLLSAGLGAVWWLRRGK